MLSEWSGYGMVIISKSNKKFVLKKNQTESANASAGLCFSDRPIDTHSMGYETFYWSNYIFSALSYLMYSTITIMTIQL